MPTWLALGDSYTIGEAVAAHERWPAVLAQRLRQAGVPLDVPQLVAVTGWSTDELVQGMDAATLAPRYELVTLQIGVNNQYRGRPAEDYRGEFAGLLARAIALAGGRAARVVVASIPDWGVTRFAAEQGRDRARIAEELDAYNAIAGDACRRAGVRFVDVTAISRRHPELLADDGLHPSAAQYALWAAAIEPAARAALRS
ncbi:MULTISPECIES: SGNH/GDSL hydrolase family protein [Rhodanobacter]|uniref:SGNH/GDSL hydrolase family protein n=1 Tax=Rhodanobacter TaxID=75309 RepID=UPI0003FD8B95|nr:MULTISPECIES: SGNH/GDSL hydrolase family protein [Rhodanobacter]KZC20793.1 lysophospholipase [Rhodanobacter denitrificans]UJM93353.1 SGNH/GDSL hydrolase family protein [Rhodanobacter denitrificans]UJM96885.1 SGNH/GDSL hydrolase family protein [Rhodanobacter denitrificans]UJN20288.1 SGNH/GDSL hydrolase family protein [Rhodanobacter denitrificans]